MYAYFELITIIDFLEFLAVCKFTAFTLLNFLAQWKMFKSYDVINHFYRSVSMQVELLGLQIL